MRRLLLVLLCFVLPLKAVAAAAVPIVGAWSHKHDPNDVAAHVHLVAQTSHHDNGEQPSSHSHCDAFADDSNASTPLHEHSCPHMGMVSISGPIVIFPQLDSSPESPVESPALFASVIQKVPSPPPTLLR